MCHLKLNLESAIIDYCAQQASPANGPSGVGSEEKLIVSKKMTMKGLSVDVNRVVDRISPNNGLESPSNPLANQTRDMFDDKGNALILSLQHLLSNEHQYPDPSLLSPVEVSLTLSVWSMPPSLMPPSSLPPSASEAQNMRVKLELQSGPIEIWPRISQLVLLKSAFTQFEWECKKVIARQKCFHLRPLSAPSRKEQNCMRWWRYAFLWELLRQQNWNSPEPLIALFSLASQRHTQRHDKQRYLHLYRKHIEWTLHEHAAHTTHSTHSTPLRTMAGSPLSQEYKQLSTEEQSELDFLHRLLDEDQLLLYRLMVHHGLQEVGITLKSIRDSIRSPLEEPSFLSFSRIFGQQTPKQNLSKEKVEESVDMKILNLLDDVKCQLAESKRMVQTVFATEIFLPGISIILSNSNEIASKMSNMSALLLLSQVHVSFRKSSVDHSDLSVNMGGVRIFGLQGFELLSCGLVTEVPPNSVEQAIHLKIEWKVFDDDDPVDDPSGGISLGVLRKQSVQHANVSIIFNSLSVKWSESAVNLLQHDLNEYLNELCLSAPPVHSQSHAYSKIRMKCAQYSMTNSPKSRKMRKDIYWSFILSSKGVTLDFPLGDSADPKPKSTLVVSFSSLEAMMGADCSNSDLLNPESANSLEDTLTRSLWPQVDQILRVKYLKLNHSIVDSVIFSLEGFTIGLRRISSSQIDFIRTPWSMKGIFSHCLFPCHKSYPENQFDLYCSPLTLSLKLKVL
jgi:hypothetical protein